MADQATTAWRLDRGALHRTLPFALFMSFVGLDEALRFAAQRHWFSLEEPSLYYLYPVRAFAVGVLLYLLRRQYTELRFSDLLQLRVSFAAACAGLATFLLWINVTATLPGIAPPNGFNPLLLPEGALRAAMTSVRVAGAVVVVPVMEELFWRSFLLRYLVDPDFETVPLGRFSWGSFLVAAVLFGLEHHFFFAGIIAGAIFSLVLYKTRSLAQCVLAHAVANLALAFYVLHSAKWYFW